MAAWPSARAGFSIARDAFEITEKDPKGDSFGD